MRTVVRIDRREWLRRGLWLVGGTMAYNVVEAVVAVWSGVRAGSIALVGFGLDSVIELAAATMVFWRVRLELTNGEGRSGEAERKVRRFVGVTFFLLAGYVVIEAVSRLVAREAAEESWIGIVLAIASLIVMPLLALAKFRVADALGSAALRAEAKETLACSYLSVTLLAGLAANAWTGWWWADPAAALVMVPWLIHEGREGFEEEDEDDDD